MSWTARPRSSDIGSNVADVAFIEYESQFHPERRPVYILQDSPRVRGAGRMSIGETRVWINKIDAVLSKRADTRKGIIHAVSYQQAEEILLMSKWAASMVTHDRRGLAAAINRFKAADAPAILVSPSVREGFDFPYRQCEFQIVVKVPFVDHSGPVMKARHREDKQYLDYLAIQALIQSCGRGMRAADDRCETFIVDGNIEWLLARNRKLIPRWFRRSIKFVRSVPVPPARALLIAAS